MLTDIEKDSTNSRPAPQMEQMLQAMTNQSIHHVIHNFAKTTLPSPVAWIDHFENVIDYHRWIDDQNAHEIKTLLKGIMAT